MLTYALRGTPARENWFRSERGRVLAHYDNGSRGYGRPAVNLRRADLHWLLVSALRDLGGEVVTGNRVTHVAATATTVTMTCSDGHTATGDLLVGADGLHSGVRVATWPHGPAPTMSVSSPSVGSRPSRSCPCCPSDRVRR
jgi:2-polyprenyl-6-methoxyphenol hydroxylase-like FAD-dependent oxidoreductase